MQFPVAEQILGLEQMHEDDMRRNLLDSSEVVREDTTNLRPSWVSLFFCCFAFLFFVFCRLTSMFDVNVVSVKTFSLENSSICLR